MKNILILLTAFVSLNSFASTIQISGQKAATITSIGLWDATDIVINAKSKDDKELKFIMATTAFTSGLRENSNTKISYGELLNIVVSGKAEINCYGKSNTSNNVVSLDSESVCAVGINLK